MTGAVSSTTAESLSWTELVASAAGESAVLTSPVMEIVSIRFDRSGVFCSNYLKEMLNQIFQLTHNTQYSIPSIMFALIEANDLVELLRTFFVMLGS